MDGYYPLSAFEIMHIAFEQSPERGWLELVSLGHTSFTARPGGVVLRELPNSVSGDRGWNPPSDIRLVWAYASWRMSRSEGSHDKVSLPAAP